MTVTDGLPAPPIAPSHEPAASRRWRCLAETAFALLVLDVATVANALWVAQAVALAALLLLPGFLVLRALRFSGSDMLRSPGWLVSCSLVALMAIGLAVDLVGPLVGVDRPLSTLPVAVGINVACVALSLLPGCGSPVAAIVGLGRGIDPAATWSLVAPLVAVLGALRLNNGHSSLVAVTGAVAAVALVGLGVLRARTFTPQRLGWLLYAATSALLLGFSMRSDYVFGWDISAELSLVERTIVDGSWATAHPGDAYGAMLSLTVLPAVLSSLAGVSALVLLKLVLPLLFALMPVVVFVLLRAVLTQRAAFVGAALLLTQSSFIAEMPALARQEVALLVFVSLLAALVAPDLPPRGGIALLVILTAGVVVAHYSTTYTLATLLAGAVVIRLVLGRYHGVPLLEPRKLLVLGTTALLGFVWYQGVTNSTDHAVATVSQLLESGLRILPSSGDEDPLQAYLRGPNPPTTVSVPEYQAQIAAEYAHDRPWVVTAADGTDPQWALTPATDPPARVSAPRLNAVADLAALVFSQLLVLCVVAGTMTLLLLRRVRGPLIEFAFLALPALGLLAVVRLSAAIAETYGQDRLYIQLMPIVAVPALWGLGTAWSGMEALVGRFAPRVSDRVPRIVRGLLVAGVGCFVVLVVALAAGLQKAAVGDHSPANLFNGGERHTRFYVTAPEVAAAQWLARAQPTGSLTYSDDYGQLRIFGYGEPKGVILTDVTPRTVDVNSWVYASHANTVDRQGRVNYDGQLILYAFPQAFLSHELGVAYTNGSSEVFHR